MVEYLKVKSFSYENAEIIEAHSHRRAQLIYSITGIMEVRVGNKLWRVPPQRAVWMPPNVLHSMRAFGKVELRTVYVPPQLAPERFGSPLLISVSGLMRELVLRGIETPSVVLNDNHTHRVLTWALEELESLLEEGARTPEFNIPLPSGRDKRIARICNAIVENPGHLYHLNEWAEIVGASKRTLTRIFQKELGMSFISWRQQVRVVAALSRLDQGEPVTVIAGDLGYETPTAFSMMFRKVTGMAPSNFAAATAAH